MKLLINQNTGEAVAMKVVDLAKHPDAIDAVRKEMCLHRMLKSPHIVKFYGKGNFFFVFIYTATLSLIAILC